MVLWGSVTTLPDNPACNLCRSVLLLRLLLTRILLKLPPLLMFAQLHLQHSPENLWRQGRLPVAIHCCLLPTEHSYCRNFPYKGYSWSGCRQCTRNSTGNLID